MEQALAYDPMLHIKDVGTGGGQVTARSTLIYRVNVHGDSS